jgi:hypothetical protein
MLRKGVAKAQKWAAASGDPSPWSRPVRLSPIRGASYPSSATAVPFWGNPRPPPVEGETVEEVQESEEPEPVEQSPKPGLFDRVRVWVRGW